MIYYLTIIIIIVIVNFYKKKINMKNLKHVLLFVVFIDSNQRKNISMVQGWCRLLSKIIG